MYYAPLGPVTCIAFPESMMPRDSMYEGAYVRSVYSVYFAWHPIWSRRFFTPVVPTVLEFHTHRTAAPRRSTIVGPPVLLFCSLDGDRNFISRCAMPLLPSVALYLFLVGRRRFPHPNKRRPSSSGVILKKRPTHSPNRCYHSFIDCAVSPPILFSK